MSVWSRPGQVDDQVMVRRANAMSPVALDFRAIMSNGVVVPGSVRTIFEHRDQRVWTCQIKPLGEPNPFERLRCDTIVRLVTDGMPPVIFVARSLPAGKAVAARFANMVLADYTLLTNMATPTTDHPLPGVEVELTIRYPDGTVEDRNGRDDGSTIVLYPTVEQALATLERITDQDTFVGLTSDHGSISLRTSPGAPVRRIELPSEFQQNPRRQFGAAASALDTLVTIPEREERNIQL